MHLERHWGRERRTISPTTRADRDGIRRFPINKRLELIGCLLAENVMFRVEDDGTFTIGEKVAAEAAGGRSDE